MSPCFVPVRGEGVKKIDFFTTNTNYGYKCPFFGKNVKIPRPNTLLLNVFSLVLFSRSSIFLQFFLISSMFSADVRVDWGAIQLSVDLPVGMPSHSC